MLRLPDYFDPAERGERARNYFLEGYNCCQAVLLAFADVLEANGQASEELLKTIGSGFGGGFARLREVCGSFSACTMMAGFLSPATTPGMAARTANYALVQELRRNSVPVTAAASSAASCSACARKARKAPPPPSARRNIIRNVPVRKSSATPPRSWQRK